MFLQAPAVRSRSYVKVQFLILFPVQGNFPCKKIKKPGSERGYSDPRTAGTRKGREKPDKVPVAPTDVVSIDGWGDAAERED